jgi:hypothetical protein
MTPAQDPPPAVGIDGGSVGCGNCLAACCWDTLSPATAHNFGRFGAANYAEAGGNPVVRRMAAPTRQRGSVRLFVDLKLPVPAAWSAMQGDSVLGPSVE